MYYDDGMESTIDTMSSLCSAFESVSTMADSLYDSYKDFYDLVFSCDCSFKRPSLHDLWPAIAEVFNLKCQLLISIMTNVFAATFYRRAIFSKSGFVGRVAKRRKGK